MPSTDILLICFSLSESVSHCLTASYTVSVNNSLSSSSDPNVPFSLGGFKHLHYITLIALWLPSVCNVVSLSLSHRGESVSQGTCFPCSALGRCRVLWHSSDTGLLTAGLKKLTLHHGERMGDDNFAPKLRITNVRQQKESKVQVLSLDYNLKCHLI